MTQPIGTSPDFPAFSAVFSAKSMKEGAFMPRIIPKNLLVHGPSAKVDSGFARHAPLPARILPLSRTPSQASSETFMPRDNDRHNDSRGRRDGPAGGKG